MQTLPSCVESQGLFLFPCEAKACEARGRGVASRGEASAVGAEGSLDLWGAGGAATGRGPRRPRQVLGTAKFASHCPSCPDGLPEVTS